MPTTDFADGTTVEADWLNEVDAHVFESIQPHAWGRVENDGASATLIASSNIASAVRTGAGTVRITFTAAPADSSYAVIVTAHDGGNVNCSANLINGGNFTVLTWTADSGVASDSNFMFMVLR